MRISVSQQAIIGISSHSPKLVTRTSVSGEPLLCTCCIGLLTEIRVRWDITDPLLYGSSSSFLFTATIEWWFEYRIIPGYVAWARFRLKKRCAHKFNRLIQLGGLTSAFSWNLFEQNLTLLLLHVPVAASRGRGEEETCDASYSLLLFLPDDIIARSLGRDYSSLGYPLLPVDKKMKATCFVCMQCWMSWGRQQVLSTNHADAPDNHWRESQPRNNIIW